MSHLAPTTYSPRCCYWSSVRCVNTVNTPLSILSFLTAFLVGILGITGTASSVVVSGTLFAAAGVAFVALVALPKYEKQCQRLLIGQLVYFALFGGLTISGVVSPYTIGWVVACTAIGLITLLPIAACVSECLKGREREEAERNTEHYKIHNNFRIFPSDQPIREDCIVTLDPKKDYRTDRLVPEVGQFFRYRESESEDLVFRFFPQRDDLSPIIFDIRFTKGPDGTHLVKSDQNIPDEYKGKTLQECVNMLNGAYSVNLQEAHFLRMPETPKSSSWC
jgi:hypothetical protein